MDSWCKLVNKPLSVWKDKKNFTFLLYTRIHWYSAKLNRFLSAQRVSILVILWFNYVEGPYRYYILMITIPTDASATVQAGIMLLWYYIIFQFIFVPIVGISLVIIFLLFIWQNIVTIQYIYICACVCVCIVYRDRV